MDHVSKKGFGLQGYIERAVHISLPKLHYITNVFSQNISPASLICI